jgi:hypothetical protein
MNEVTWGAICDSLKAQELHVVFVVMFRFACRWDCSRLDFVSTSRNSKQRVCKKTRKAYRGWSSEVIHRHYRRAWAKALFK